MLIADINVYVLRKRNVKDWREEKIRRKKLLSEDFLPNFCDGKIVKFGDTHTKMPIFSFIVNVMNNQCFA